MSMMVYNALGSIADKSDTRRVSGFTHVFLKFSLSIVGLGLLDLSRAACMQGIGGCLEACKLLSAMVYNALGSIAAKSDRKRVSGFTNLRVST